MSDIPNHNSASVSRQTRPRVGLLAALAVVISIYLLSQWLLSGWRENTDEAGASVYVPRLSLIGFELVENEGKLSIVARLKNIGKASAINVSVVLQDELVPPEGPAAPGSEAKLLTLNPNDEATYDLGLLGAHLLRWQGRCAGCYFLGVGKNAMLPVEVIASSCKGLIDRGKRCHLDYRLLPEILNLRFLLNDGVRIEGRLPIYVYLSQTAETPYRIPKY